jgi:outer membrane protein
MAPSATLKHPTRRSPVLEFLGSTRNIQGVNETRMTRKLTYFVLPVALLALSAFAQTGAAANTGAAAPAGSKIGIINIQQAIVGTNEGQRDFGDLQKKFAPTQDKLNALNKEIEGLQNQLRTQGEKMNDDARTTLTKNIETKQKTLQREAEDAQGDFQNQQGEIANKIGGKLMDIIDKYAKQNGYLMILDVSNPQSPVLWAANTTDVTKEIVDAYNAQSGVAAPAAPAAGTPSAPRPQGTRPAGTTGAPKSPAAPKQ